MKKTHVAIIDDGVNEKLFNTLLIHDIEITDNLELIKRLKHDVYEKSHGTNCAAIISKYCCNIYLSSIKILDMHLLSNKDKLVKAIEWCIDNDVDVISLSIGSMSYNDKKEIKEVIDKACLKNITIVSANSNEGTVTYPTYFHNVIGIKRDKEAVLEHKQFIYNMDSVDNIEIIANGTHDLIDCFGEIRRTGNCNSYAAPLITAEVINIKQKNNNLCLKDIKEQLWKKSMNYNKEISFYEGYNNLEWIDNAIIFSTNSMQYLKKNCIFSIESIIKIRNTELEKVLYEIEFYLLENSVDLMNVDTIIIDINKINVDISNVIIEEFFKHVSILSKNVIFMNSTLANKSFFNILKKYNKALYLNYICEERMVIEDNAEIPSIIIYHEDEEELCSILISLAQKFKADGYNSVPVTNTMRGLYYGHCYLPVEHCDDLEQLNFNVNNKVNYFNGDICIIGITKIQKDFNYIYLMKENLDTDIYIIFDNKNSNKYDNLLGESSEEIVLLCEYEKNQGEYIYTSKEDYLQQLYNKIILLYAAEG